MEIVFYENAPQKVIKDHDYGSIFLAGPTLRNDSFDNSWRKEACELLKSLGFEGTVFVPEFKENTVRDKKACTYWEWEALDNSDIIVFWIPRNETTLPGFTTNVEFGRYTALVPHKVIMGHPKEAIKMSYLDMLYQKECHDLPCDNLTETLYTAIKQCSKVSELRN